MIWIEVLSRHGEGSSRFRVDGDEARIGRAFDNDVVVDDPHVAPHHLRVFRSEDGALVAEDLGTLNGLFAEHGAARVQRVSLSAAPGLRIGRTTVRVFDAAHAVAPEKLLMPPRAHARWAAVLGVALFAGLFLVSWLNLTTEPNASVLLLPLLGLVTGVALWAGTWALISRVFYGQARFALQLAIAFTACIALVLWDQLTETASFSFAWRPIGDWSGLGAWALLAATCFAHLQAMDARHMKMAMGIVATLVVAGAALQYVGKSEARSFVGQRATLGNLRPPAFRVVPTASADEFFKRAEATRAAVDKARLKEPGGGGLLSDIDLGD